MAHDTAHQHFNKFLAQYGYPGKLLDVGGEGGEFKRITEEHGCEYCTLNCGEDATHKLDQEHPYNFNVDTQSYDIVISSSTFEHIPMFWLTFGEMARVCKRGGFIYLNAPSIGQCHWDWDGWRFLRSSMQALSLWADVRLIHSETDIGTEWCDTIGIFTKP